MDLVAIIAAVILLATLLTMLFSFAAYFVTRAKIIMKSDEASKAENQTDADPSARIYFERYDPKKKTTEPIVTGSSATVEQWR